MGAVFAVYLAAAFMAGAVPFGKLVAWAVARIDITQRGSGNIGATNVARELGLGWGILTLGLDALKGFGPVMAWGLVGPVDGPLHNWAAMAVGLAALLGHQFSPLQRLKGGKGVATALGVYLAVSPLACLLCAGVFAAAVYKWEFVSLGSISSSAAMPLALLILGKDAPYVVGALIFAALIWYKHADNIRRLIRGQEISWRRQRPG